MKFEATTKFEILFWLVLIMGVAVRFCEKVCS